jgi:thioredoxin
MNATELKTNVQAGPLTVTDRTFGTEVLNATEPVLVDFWAPWCGPCRAIGPVVEALAGQYAGRAKVVKLNVDDNPETATRYEISAIPTLLVFKHGQVVDQVRGLASKKVLAMKLEAQFG